MHVFLLLVLLQTAQAAPWGDTRVRTDCMFVYTFEEGQYSQATSRSTTGLTDVVNQPGYMEFGNPGSPRVTLDWAAVATPRQGVWSRPPAPGPSGGTRGMYSQNSFSQFPSWGSFLSTNTTYTFETWMIYTQGNLLRWFVTWQISLDNTDFVIAKLGMGFTPILQFTVFGSTVDIAAPPEQTTLHFVGIYRRGIESLSSNITVVLRTQSGTLLANFTQAKTNNINMASLATAQVEVQDIVMATAWLPPSIPDWLLLMHAGYNRSLSWVEINQNYAAGPPLNLPYAAVTTYTNLSDSFFFIPFSTVICQSYNPPARMTVQINANVTVGTLYVSDLSGNLITLPFLPYLINTTVPVVAYRGPLNVFQAYILYNCVQNTLYSLPANLTLTLLPNPHAPGPIGPQSITDGLENFNTIVFLNLSAVVEIDAGDTLTARISSLPASASVLYQFGCASPILVVPTTVADSLYRVCLFVLPSGAYPLNSALPVGSGSGSFYVSLVNFTFDVHDSFGLFAPNIANVTVRAINHLRPVDLQVGGFQGIPILFSISGNSSMTIPFFVNLTSLPLAGQLTCDNAPAALQISYPSGTQCSYVLIPGQPVVNVIITFVAQENNTRGWLSPPGTVTIENQEASAIGDQPIWQANETEFAVVMLNTTGMGTFTAFISGLPPAGSNLYQYNGSCPGPAILAINTTVTDSQKRLCIRPFPSSNYPDNTPLPPDSGSGEYYVGDVSFEFRVLNQFGGLSPGIGTVTTKAINHLQPDNFTVAGFEGEFMNVSFPGTSLIGGSDFLYVLLSLPFPGTLFANDEVAVINQLYPSNTSFSYILTIIHPGTLTFEYALVEDNERQWQSFPGTVTLININTPHQPNITIISVIPETGFLAFTNNPSLFVANINVPDEANWPDRRVLHVSLSTSIFSLLFCYDNDVTLEINRGLNQYGEYDSQIKFDFGSGCGDTDMEISATLQQLNRLLNRMDITGATIIDSSFRMIACLYVPSISQVTCDHPGVNIYDVPVEVKYKEVPPLTSANFPWDYFPWYFWMFMGLFIALCAVCCLSNLASFVWQPVMFCCRTCCCCTCGYICNECEPRPSSKSTKTLRREVVELRGETIELKRNNERLTDSLEKIDEQRKFLYAELARTRDEYAELQSTATSYYRALQGWEEWRALHPD
jgi:hypothetical protein